MRLLGNVADPDSFPECSASTVDREKAFASLRSRGYVLNPGQRFLYTQYRLPGGWQYCWLTVGQ